MTLSRQLVVLVILMLLLAFAGTFLISVQNTRAYLQNQLESHAQDAATSLGLSISTHLTDGDMATVTSMTDAIFDRGYYRLVRVEDMKGKPLVERILPVKLDDVPDWFIERLPLDTPVGEAAVMSGWVQAGWVEVRSHPGYAYTQLWRNVEETFWWFVISAVIVLVIGISLLHAVLRPLKQVEQQADAICNREFPVVEPLPKTLDLRRIVEAMNRMSSKVQGMLDELVKLAGQLRKQAHQHPVTGLANKAHFIDMLGTLVQSREEFSKGGLCLVQLRDFKAYNDKNGYQAGDELLCIVAEQLSDLVQQYPGASLAHLAGADFALLVQDIEYDQVEELARKLSSRLSALYATGRLDDPDVGHVGAACFDGSQSVSELLAQADTALQQARSLGGNSWRVAARDAVPGEQARGALAWRDFILQSLDEGRIVLQFQPVLSSPGRAVLHREVLVRIAPPSDAVESGLMNAGVFMPQAESLGLTQEIDRAVVSQVLALLQQEGMDGEVYAINLSPSSLDHEDFMIWLEQQLMQNAGASRRVIFEMPEYGAVARIDRVQQLIGMLSRYGAGFAIDHFGRSFGSFAYLHSCKLSYLKVDGSYMRSLDKNRENQFFIHALAEIAHGLEIVVIGELIESEVVWNLLPELNIDGGQGYYLGPPE